MRDTLKDKKFFDDHIIELDELNKESIKELENNEVSDEFIPDVIEGIFDFDLRKVFCLYSRGDDIELVKEAYLKAIESYYNAKEARGIRYDEGYSDYDFPHTLAMLCMGILFDIRGELLEKLLDVLGTIESKYKIINYFLSYFINVPQIKTPDKLEHAFKNFNAMIDMDNEEILSTNAMKKYLDSWQKHHLRGFLAQTHDDFTNIYVGYWSFESAAFVKMRGLDDSSFRDSPYYPKDLL